MGDAEDVLIHAAEHVAVTTRALWRRGSDPRAAAAQRAASAERRIALWQAAQGAEPLPVTAWDAPGKASWLVRTLGRPAPWQERPAAIGWSDGAQLFLPRARLEGERASDAERLLLVALAQGRRVAQGRTDDAGGCSIARDVRFVLEAALGDAELAVAFPGLAPALDAARSEALGARPALARLRLAERAVEELVRALLAGPAAEAARAVAAQCVDGETPARVAAVAREWSERLEDVANGYRGSAPVEHWGAPAAGRGAGGAVGVRAQASASTGRSPQARSLERPVLRRPAEDEDGDGRSGPFVLPHGDPQLAVQDAAGVARPEDRGDEDLDALADELGRAGVLPTVRSEGDVREVLESGRRSPRAAAAVATSAPAATTFVYPEWDAARGAYRDPGIVLRETLLPAADPDWASRERGPLLAQLRRHFEALRPRRERVGRQLDGDTLDVDGVAAEYAERRAGLSPEGRLYARERPRRRDVAVALLIDASGSTDGWVSGGERVIDIAKLAALCLGEALAALGDRHAIYAFSGRGPGDVRVGVAKRFAEPWSAAVRARIGAPQPDRSTRLGGPIRHVTARLVAQPARARLLLVLSDGKPDDDDAYEGRYGLEDVRQAVGEARSAGVRPFCVTIDRAGSGYLPHLFGAHGYTVLWDVQQLPARLPAVYRRLAGL